MDVTIVDRKKIIQEIRNMSCGKKIDLNTNLNNAGISATVIENVCDELGLIGVIRYGCDGLGELRFKLTDFGKDYCDSLLTFSDTKQRLSNLVKKLKLD